MAKSGGSEALEFEKWGSSLAALQRFAPMPETNAVPDRDCLCVFLFLA